MDMIQPWTFVIETNFSMESFNLMDLLFGITSNARIKIKTSNQQISQQERNGNSKNIIRMHSFDRLNANVQPNSLT